MKSRLLLTALASLTIASTAHAQLGWTLDQCKAKFGEPTAIDPDDTNKNDVNFRFAGVCTATMTFSSSGRIIEVLYGYEMAYLVKHNLHAHEKYGAELKKDLGELVSPYSPEIASWWAMEAIGEGDRGTYLGLTWRKDEDDYSVGYKNGRPVVRVNTSSGDNLMLELPES